jgi:HEAT repeat protein
MVTVQLAGVARAAEHAADSTDSLVAVLQRPDSSFFDKARACQRLGEIGSPQAVPVLAGFLSDAKLDAYARSGLEGIGGPSAAAALRDAAPKLGGPMLAGVVNSLGVLRDPQATDQLRRLASASSSGVVAESLLALGNISTEESIRFLEEALTTGPEITRSEAAAACLLAADRQRVGGNVKLASSLFDLIRKAKVPAAYHAAATRGAILTRKTDRAHFLMKQLGAKEPAVRSAVLLTIREVPDEALANLLNKEVPRTTGEFQQQLLLAIVDCHDAKSIQAVQTLVSSPDSQTRKTALIVLGRLGPGAAPALLAALQQERPVEERMIALSGLRTLEGAAVDDILLQALNSAKAPGFQIDLIRLLDARGVAKATPEMLKLGAAPDKNVRIAAFSALGSLAGQSEVPALIGLIQTCHDEDVRAAAESALASVCSRSGDAASQAVLNELKQATTLFERSCWFRVLAQVGYSEALPVIEVAASDPESEVASNAVAELGRWPNPAPMEAVLKVMSSGATPQLRRRALVSVIDLATTATDEAQAPDPAIVSWLQRINWADASTDDKRRLLGLLGRLKTDQSLKLLLPCLDDPRLRTEAASGIVQIAPALSKGENAERLKTALEKISTTVDNSDLRNRALQLVKTIAVAAPPVSMFDGVSLAGWEGDTNVWRVREGLIVGGSLKGNPRNEFLATIRSYTNFVLRLEYKLVGTEGFVNSGVQFRSVRLSNPPSEMKGYQADIGAGYSGCLYDESRRNAFLARAGPETIQRLEKTNDWNHYEIHCEGTHIQLWLNGEKTVDYSEPDPTLVQSGLFGLQIHGGNKAEVSFRNIMLQEF